MTSSDTPRPLRFGTLSRGAGSAVFIAAYSWLLHLPAAPFKESLLWAAALQLLVICVRRFVPPESQPRTIEWVELLADGATVLLFALGVFGGILQMPTDL